MNSHKIGIYFRKMDTSVSSLLRSVRSWLNCPFILLFHNPLIFMLNISDFSTEIQLIHDKHPFRVIQFPLTSVVKVPLILMLNILVSRLCVLYKVTYIGLGV